MMSLWTLAIGSLILFSTSTFAFKPIQFKSEGQKLQLEEVFTTSDIIWAFKFLPDGRILFTEKAGAMKIFNPQNKSFITLKGVPKVDSRGQGGLLDVALHPQFAKNKRIYFSYSEKGPKGNTTALAMAELAEPELKNLKVIFRAMPWVDSRQHFGSRIVFDDKGFLFFCMGERNHRDYSQKLDNHLGKVLRLTDEGAIPPDNPFVKNPKAKSEIWTYGNRNPQGMLWSAERKEIWVAEHGPRGGDEINLIKPGTNYGWPVITYGREYYGPKIGPTHKEGMEQPLKYFAPSIAPSNMSFYTGNKLKAWKGNLFIGALVLTHLNRQVVEDHKFIKEERLLEDWGQRIRDVHEGPDEWLYLATDSGILARIRLEAP